MGFECFRGTFAVILCFKVTIHAAPQNDAKESVIQTIMNEMGIKKPYGQLSKMELVMILAKLEEKYRATKTVDPVWKAEIEEKAAKIEKEIAKLKVMLGLRK